MMFDRTTSRAKNVAAAIRAERPEVAAAEKGLGSRLTIAKNVVRLRVQRGYTQTQLAELLDIRQPRIAEIEGARANLQVDTLDRLAKAFGVEASTLLKRDRPMRRSQAVYTSPVVSAAPPRSHSLEWDRSRRAYGPRNPLLTESFDPAEINYV